MYSGSTFIYIKRIAGFIRAAASAKGVSANAVAGAIADEYEARNRLWGTVDWLQDAVLDDLSESSIDVDRHFDFHSKLLNALENDVGPANFKVRTALELVQSGELSVVGSPAAKPVVSKIIDSLLTDEGTARATAAYIAQAQRVLSPFLTTHTPEERDAIYITYFKRGPSVYTGLVAKRAANPAYKAQPGNGGTEFLENHATLVRAMGGSYP